MSVQFGRWNFDGQSVDPEYISRVRSLLAPYAPDSITICVKGPYFVLYGALHTTEESRHERQPLISAAGTHLIWSGRLDNRSELIAGDHPLCDPNATDLVIVSSLYEKRGVEALGRLSGDWSLSAVHHYERRLVLAVDFLGSQPLYYLHCNRYVAWSSVLEPLVTLADQSFTLSEDYVAGWLYGFPEASVTPYSEIRAVPPGAFVEITRTATMVQKHWEFRPVDGPSTSSDAECEEGFRHYFTQAVRRRLPSSGPVVSELSGGMDSSSIVCIADRVLASEPGLAARLDTLSYLNDAEPDWNERPFVTAIEELRSKAGLHIDVNDSMTLIPRRDPERFAAAPNVGLLPSRPEREVSAYLNSTGTRVILSGLGGDEVTGGVPDGTAELTNLLVQLRLMTFLRRSIAWCLPTRRPLIHLVGGVVGEFLPRNPFTSGQLKTRVPWLNRDLERRHRADPTCSTLRLRLFDLPPSVQENLFTLDDLRRQIAGSSVPSSPPRERRYPFLDKDLLEFLYNAPREQIVEPGRRRSLMRRALAGIVPAEVLERKRKAYVSRSPIKSFQSQREGITEWSKSMLCAELGAIDLKAFQKALSEIYRGEDSGIWQLGRTLAFESWLRDERVQQRLRFPQRSPSIQERFHSNVNDFTFERKVPQLGKPE
jgi:asparagine synthase (glutamine-hydrolysing)